MGYAYDGSHVVFAIAFKADVAQDNHFVIAFNFLKRALEKRGWVFVIAAEPLLVGAGHAGWRVEQAFAVWIVTGPL